MLLSASLGQAIIEQVSPIIDYHLNLMDERGYVVASTDVSRIGEQHTGAMIAIQEKRPITIDFANQNDYPGTKSGVNLPIWFQEQVVGVVGVSGQPNDILPMAKLVQKTVQLLMEQLFIQNEQREREERWNRFMHCAREQRLSDDEIETRFIQLTDHSFPQNSQLLYFHALLDPVAIQRVKNDVARLAVHVICTYAISEGLFIWISGKPFHEQNRWPEWQWVMSQPIETVQQFRTTLRTLPHLRLNGHRVEEEQLDVFVQVIPEDIWETFFKEEKEAVAHLKVEDWETIAQFVEQNGSLKHTAKQLMIHRNTLTYRLQKIAEQTGLHPQRFDQLFFLYALFVHLHKKEL